MSETFSFEQFGAALRIAGLSSRVDAPKVLLAATDRWYPTARLGMALAKAGCVVEAVCPPGHPLSLTRTLRQMHRYNGLLPLASFSRAIRASKPDLIVPADDLATWHLHELHKSDSRYGSAGREICKTIERSLGCVESFAVVGARDALMQVAKEEGIRVPHSAVIANASDLHGWIARTGFPTVLKANGTSGGDGVKIVNTVQEAERAFHKLQSPPLLARAVKRAVIDSDLTLVRPSLFRRRPIVNAQSFVAGHEATSAIFCWEGKVLASLHFEVLEKARATGHATVVRWMKHQEMLAAAEKIARRLKLSGFHGLDFMVEAKTGKSYLIELNPRATQVGHLALGEGHDLPAALYSAVTEKCVEASAPLCENDTIALFPQEWMRDPGSAFLLSAYHDVPWQEPGIVSACADAVRQQERRRNRKFTSVPRASNPAVGEPTAAIEPEPASLVAGQNEI